LDRVGGHARAHVKPQKSRVYDNKVSHLSPPRGSYISRLNGGIHHGVCGVLRVRIWHAIESISPLLAAVLCLRAASLDSYRDPAYGGLRDPAQGLH
jgi:hypothetical protein